MENIAYDLFNITKFRIEPGVHSLSYQKYNPRDLSISHYMSVQIMYKHLNRVRYTRLKLDTMHESCARFQFYAGYHTGGKDKYLFISRVESSYRRHSVAHCYKYIETKYAVQRLFGLH